MKNVFTFKGRLNRAKYFKYHIFAYFIGVLVGLVMTLLPFNEESTFTSIFNSIICIVYLSFCICVMVQRLHDLNFSGKCLWKIWLPVYNFYLIFIILFKKGTEGANDYGEDPLGYEGIA